MLVQTESRPAIKSDTVEFAWAGHSSNGPDESSKRRFRRAVLNPLLVEEGDRLLSVIRAAGIEALIIKGPRLSERLYSSATARDHADIDLVVNPGHVGQATELLLERGYTAESREPGSPILRGSCQNALYKTGPVQVMVELHWRLYPRHLPLPARLELGELWPRFTSHGFDFDDDDLALYLCFHWAKEWEDIEKLHLFAAALRRCETFPWDTRVQEAEAEGTLRTLLLGAFMAHRCCGVEVPREVVDRAERDSGVMENARHAAAVFVQTPESVSVWRNVRFSWNLLMTWKDRSKYVWYNLAMPTLAEYRAWPLPARWHWIYYFLRPVRLIWRHSLGRLLPNTAGW